MRSIVSLCFAAALVALAPACSSSDDGSTGSGTTQATGSITGFTSDAAGFDTNTWFYDTGREVVVFDAQFTPALAEQVIAAIGKATSSPIKYVVVTHPNPDKFNGAAAFQAVGAKVVASRATAEAIPGVHAYKKAFFVETAKMFTNETYPAEAKIDVTFDDELSLELEAGEVSLIELSGPGVSSTQIVARIPALEAIVVGDLLHPNTHAWLEGGIVDGAARPEIDGWIASLDEVREKTPQGFTVFPGRGKATKLEAAAVAQQDYLRKMRDVVGAYVNELEPGSLAGADAGTHWKALAGVAEKAFPGYALPYLIEYGVYGLAFSLVASPEG